jgi:hypothetical protein
VPELQEMQLPKLMACNPYKQIRHQQVRSSGVVLVFHIENMKSWMVHIPRWKEIAAEMHQESVMNQISSQQVPSFRRRQVGIPATPALPLAE